MAKEKKSFFERLTGAVNVPEYEEEEEKKPVRGVNIEKSDRKEPAWEEDEEEGQLMVDVYQTDSDIIIKTLVAGVRPDDLDVSITRDMVTIKGTREASREIDDGNYFHKELYWGSFSRTVLLPQEVDVDGAEATEKHGMLILKLPKLNKGKETKVKVKSA